MSNHKVKCTDVNGDILTIKFDGTNASVDCSNFNIPINSDKIKRLVDSIQGIQNLLDDFNFKKLEVELGEVE